MKLSKKQEKLLEEIINYIRREQVPPTTRELMENLGYKSPRNISQYLKALENKGYIQRGKGARNIKIIKMPINMKDKNIKHCVQCGDKLKEAGKLMTSMFIGNGRVYVCENPACPNFGLLQRGE